MSYIQYSGMGQVAVREAIYKQGRSNTVYFWINLIVIFTALGLAYFVWKDSKGEAQWMQEQLASYEETNKLLLKQVDLLEKVLEQQAMKISEGQKSAIASSKAIETQ